MCRNMCVCVGWVYVSVFVTWRCAVVRVVRTVEGLQVRDRWTQLLKAAAAPGRQRLSIKHRSSSTQSKDSPGEMWDTEQSRGKPSQIPHMLGRCPPQKDQGSHRRSSEGMPTRALHRSRGPWSAQHFLRGHRPPDKS
ncbi:hypothetical protein ATANTOWER_024051 [Ataeniobius toweri]|uniref:Secreted protein n=1 Tax=Ataeniobius toweri TaxID=208326 RepID=A0ABU7AT77_9TELE|nr:hypothetical protein [Ataeniobius toweri]